jgi:hypothetical protein
MSSPDKPGRSKRPDPPEFLVDEEFLEGDAPAESAPEGTPQRRHAPRAGPSEGTAPEADDPSPPGTGSGFFADEEFLGR